MTLFATATYIPCIYLLCDIVQRYIITGNTYVKETVFEEIYITLYIT